MAINTRNINVNAASQGQAQFGTIVTKARQILAGVQTGLIPKAATNTAENTNVARLYKTIGDLADLVETTYDPVWKETYRITLARCLAAVEKSNANAGATPNSSQAITRQQQDVITFNHPAIGIVPGLDVSSWSARQAAYQQRFNPPPPALPGPFLPLDPVAQGNEYKWIDAPGVGTTAMSTATNPGGSQPKPRGAKPLGTSH